MAATAIFWLPVRDAYAQKASTADSLYTLAVAEHNAGNSEAAIALYGRVVALDSTNADAYWNRAILLDDYASSLSDFEAVTRHAPAFGAGWGAYGWSLLLNQRWTESAAASRRAVKLEPNNFTWRLNLGHATLVDGRRDSALVAYEGAIGVMSRSDLASADADFDLFEKRGWAEGASGVKRWFNVQYRSWRQPQLRSDSLWAVATSEEEAGDYVLAAVAFEEAGEAEVSGERPRRTDTWASFNRAGLAYESAGDYVSAARMFERALASVDWQPDDEDWAHVLTNATEAHAQNGDTALAVPRADEAVEVAMRADRADLASRALSAVGVLYSVAGETEKSITSHERALALSRSISDSTNIEISLGNVGWRYVETGNYKKGLERYTEALEIARARNPSAVSRRLRDVAYTYAEMDDVVKAEAMYSEALALAESAEDSMVVIGNVGSLLIDWGRYDEALEAYEEAMALAERLNNRASIAIYLNNIGDVYGRWGLFDESIAHRERGLAIAMEIGDERNAATQLNNLGFIYSEKGDPERALDYYRRTLEILRRYDLKAEISATIANIGAVLDVLGRYDEALEHYREAREIAAEIGAIASVALIDNNIGLVYQETGRYQEAIAHFDRSLTVTDQTGNKERHATTVYNRGSAYARLGNTDRAIEDVRASIALLEEIRSTASLRVRRDYMQKELDAYQTLLIFLQRVGDPAAVLDAMAQMQARSLADQLAARGVGAALPENGAPADEDGAPVREDEAHVREDETAVREDEAAVRQDETANGATDRKSAAATDRKTTGGADQKTAGETTLTGAGTIRVGEDVVVLNYGNASHGFRPIVVAISRDGLSTYEAELDSLDSVFADSLRGRYLTLTQAVSEYRMLQARDLSTRGAAAAAASGVAGAESARRADSLRARRQVLGRALYDDLVGPLEGAVAGKREVVIVPDGILSYLPFETLIRPDGAYFGEGVDVKYVQSLEIREIVNERDYGGKTDSRRPMLAFGGAVYEVANDVGDVAADADANVVVNAAATAAVNAAATAAVNSADDVARESAYSMLSRGGDQSGTYESLGFGSWSDLPGTLEEVNAIHSIVEGSQVVSGADVSEATVKSLSADGSLADYRVIHFATHGMVVPEVPELSALVLSQGNRTGIKNAVDPAGTGVGRGVRDHALAANDGYLRMDEIAALDIAADFVNLSACETGLGKLYGGEGVVGLTQAFLVAGANGVSVSLWQVADLSTSVFMQEVYALVEADRLTYPAAIAQVKRQFAAGMYGDEWADPYYWGPFVYYGR